MATIFSSVRCMAALFCFCITLSSFTTSFPSATQLEGKWACDALTKQLDANTVLEKRCLGDLQFSSDRKLSSTCSDGFFPNGTRWKIKDNTLSLADSYGNEFVQFEIAHLDDYSLVLQKNSIAYSFARSK